MFSYPSLVMALSAALSLIQLTVASPVLPTLFSTSISPRDDTCVDTCGSVCYTQSDIDAAQAKGYELYQDGETVGDDDYPHVYHDYEGFSFNVSSPYYEFPILSSHKVYDGGSPGADRVVFNADDELAGLITHTGASDDDFDQCTSSSSSDGDD